MKQLLVLLGVLVPLSLFITGCGSGGGSSSKESREKRDQVNMEEQQKMFQEKMRMQKK